MGKFEELYESFIKRTTTRSPMEQLKKYNLNKEERELVTKAVNLLDKYNDLPKEEQDKIKEIGKKHNVTFTFNKKGKKMALTGINNKMVSTYLVPDTSDDFSALYKSQKFIKTATAYLLLPSGEFKKEPSIEE